MTSMAETGGKRFTHKQIINAWCMYDWANSAFATTILAAVLPVYYSQVAGATLSSEAVATAYWSLGLSLSLLIAAIISPILGTVSDVVRGKKQFLTAFALMGIVSTGLMVLVDTGTGCWPRSCSSLRGLASRLYGLLRCPVAAFADEDERDAVSARGYALRLSRRRPAVGDQRSDDHGASGHVGPRLSFLSVAIWWALFSIPILRRCPNPVGNGSLPAGEQCDR